MGTTLVKGAPPRGVRAKRQWVHPDTGKWTGEHIDPETKDAESKKFVRMPKGARARWRAQASVRLWTGEVVKRDAVGSSATAAEDTLKTKLQALLDASNPDEPPTDLTVAEVAKLWLEAPERFDVATSSLGVYESSCKRWLLAGRPPAVAKVRIRALEPRHVSAWLLSVAAASGIPTALTARSVLSAVVRYGMAQGHATNNPVRDATRPTERVVDAARAKQGITEATKRPGPGAQLDHQRALTGPEVERILVAAVATPDRCDDDLVDLLEFLDGTGVRVGSALATLWTDLDLDGTGWTAGTDLDPRYAWLQTGEHTITRVTGVGLVRTAYGDNKRNVRRIALPEDLADRLRKRRAEQPTTIFVFANPLDQQKPREVSFVTKRLRRIFDSTLGDDGLPLVWASSHSFRRSLATDAHDAGVPDRHIAGQGGWSSIQVLQKHYIARVPESTVGADVRNRAPRGRGDGPGGTA